MSSRSFLDIFPLEIVDIILDEFCYHIKFSPCKTCFRIRCSCQHDRFIIDPYILRDLANLNRTCRRLNELTTARLYYHPTAACNQSPLLLIRTLLARPDLAQLVRVVTARPLDPMANNSWRPTAKKFDEDEDTCDCEKCGGDGDDDGHGHGDGIEQQGSNETQSNDESFEEVFGYIADKFIASASARGLKLVPREWMKTMIRFGAASFSVEVLTSLCPNVEAVEGTTLFFSRGEYDEDPFLLLHDFKDCGEALFLCEGFWIPGVLNFPNLRLLNLGFESGWTLDDFKGLLGSAASTLQVLRVYGVNVCCQAVPTLVTTEKEGGPPAVAATGRLEKVTHLFLDFSDLDFSTLQTLVELCPNVEYFEQETPDEVICFDGRFGPEEAVAAIFGLPVRAGDQEDFQGGWKNLKTVKLRLWEPMHKDKWTEDRITYAKREFEEGGVKFTYDLVVDPDQLFTRFTTLRTRLAYDNPMPYPSGARCRREWSPDTAHFHLAQSTFKTTYKVFEDLDG